MNHHYHHHLLAYASFTRERGCKDKERKEYFLICILNFICSNKECTILWNRKKEGLLKECVFSFDDFGTLFYESVRM